MEMMKFSEIPTDKALDILCEITPYVANIATDEELLAELKSTVKVEPTATKAEMIALGVKKLVVIVPIIAKKRRSDLYGIVAAYCGVSVEYVAQQSFLTTLSQLKKVFNDEEFLAFFK